MAHYTQIQTTKSGNRPTQKIITGALTPMVLEVTDIALLRSEEYLPWVSNFLLFTFPLFVLYPFALRLPNRRHGKGM